MNRLAILYHTIDKQQSVKLSNLNWAQIRDYYDLNERIDKLFTLACFLSLRGKIKKTVNENYLTLSHTEIANSIVKYEENGFIEYENRDIYEGYLQPLIESYVKKLFIQIENHTLKLEL